MITLITKCKHKDFNSFCICRNFSYFVLKNDEVPKNKVQKRDIRKTRVKVLKKSKKYFLSYK